MVRITMPTPYVSFARKPGAGGRVVKPEVRSFQPSHAAAARSTSVEPHREVGPPTSGGARTEKRVEAYFMRTREAPCSGCLVSSFRRYVPGSRKPYRVPGCSVRRPVPGHTNHSGDARRLGVPLDELLDPMRAGVADEPVHQLAVREHAEGRDPHH